ncbi:alpha/beta hydrolase family protein [Ferruginibacter sp.]
MKNTVVRIFSRLTATVALCSAVFILQAQFTAEKIRKDLQQLLQRPAVEPRPSFTTLTTDSVIIEKGSFYSEATEKVPVLIYKPLNSTGKKLPVVICLHGTGGTKDEATIKSLLYECSKLGFMSVAIDARFHGERVSKTAGRNFYVEAIINAWHNEDPAKQTHPFFFDTVYDLWRLVDYLDTRPDVDSSRIGMTGISMGGIETWMAASVDTRIKVAVPVISAQSFKWSLQNDRWQGRAKTIWGAHVQAAKDLGDTGVNQQNVKAVWNKILPGILDEFDCPSMIQLFAPRPLLLLSNEKDQNCPLPGAQIAFDAASKAYNAANAGNKFKFNITPNEPHRFLPKHATLLLAWFKEWL